MHHALYRRQVVTASGLDLLAGIWMLISPFILGFSRISAPTTNNVVLGIIIGVIAAARFLGAYDAAWLSWLNALLGLYVLFSPWIVGFAGQVPVATTNNIILGILVIVLASWSALATNADHTEPGRRDFDRRDYNPPM